MAKFEDGCYGSLKGIALIAKVLAGRCSMHYTRVAAGKGAIPDDLTPKTLTAPPDYVMDAMISAVTNPVDGECQVSVQINSTYVEDGFYATWLILYAEDPDEGEVPFTALCLENEPEWIRPSSSVVGKLAHFDIIAAVGDVDNVTATIDPQAIVTRAEVEQIITDETNKLSSSIVFGDVSAPLETTSGKAITTGNGEEIMAHGWPAADEDGSRNYTDISVSAAASAMTQMVEAKIKSCAAEAARSALNLQNAIDALSSEIVAGDISAPFETSSGARLTARDGKAIRAHRKLVCDGGNPVYTDMVVTSAVTAMTGMLENMAHTIEAKLNSSRNYTDTSVTAAVGNLTNTLNSGYLAVHDNN